MPDLTNILNSINPDLAAEYHVQTLWLFAFVAFLLVTFNIWREGIRDGFSAERLFDFVFVGAVIEAVAFFALYHLFGRIKYQINFFDVQQINTDVIVYFLLGLLLLGYAKAYTKRVHWSIFRILDITALSLLLGTSALLLGKFLINPTSPWFPVLFLFTLLLFVTLALVRNLVLKSGQVFSLILLIFTGALILAMPHRYHLIIYGTLITISLVNLYFRNRIFMSVTKSRGNLFSILKQKLLSKRRRLVAEQQTLTKEDPYLQEGRTVGNAEDVDEAILEDYAKEVVDAEQDVLEDAQQQTDKALASMQTGKYGTCEKCGEPIDSARLKAYPEATTCFKCSKSE